MKTIQDVESFLYRMHARTHGHVEKDMTLQRMWPLLAIAGNPQEKLSVIHVAGTSGKTSTCYFIAEILSYAGLKVGLTVSPHISSITERLQVANEPVDDKIFIELFEKFIQLFGDSEIDATYFEFMVVLVLWAFVELGVEVVVLETGLGGLHDGTNVCQRSDKYCVITEIGYDHQDILGNTLEEIAAQKAGIIHENNVVFMYPKEGSVQEVFDNRITAKNARLELVQTTTDYASSSLTLYQQRNWNLAFNVASYFMLQKFAVVLNNNEAFINTKKVVPGRMQAIQSGESLFYLDGAHNTQKAHALVQSLKPKLKDKIPVILAVKNGKDSIGFLHELKSVASYVICTEYTARQDMPVASIPASELAKQAIDLGYQVELSDSIETAIEMLQKRHEPVVLVTGSLYVLGKATKKLQ